MQVLESLQRVASDPVLSKVAIVVAAVLAAILITRVVQHAVAKNIADIHLRHRIRRTIGIVGYLVGAFLIFSGVGNSLGQLTVVFGVAGAGIAFALQEVIVSVAGWAALTFGTFYRIGDRVRLGGITGDVIDIGVLRTTLMETGDWVAGDLYNGRVVRIANSFVFKEPVYNYSADFPFLWDELKLPIRYGSDWRAAEQILQRAAHTVTDELVGQSQENWVKFVQKYMVEEARVAPLVTLVTQGDWIEFTLRYITDYKSRRKSKDAICRLILSGLEEHKDTIILGAATFEILGVSERALRELQSE